MKRIVITGMGAVTPVGIGTDAYWNSIIAGKSGIDTIKSFDPSGLAVQFAGEIKDFNPADYLEKDESGRVVSFIATASCSTPT